MSKSDSHSIKNLIIKKNNYEKHTPNHKFNLEW